MQRVRSMAMICRTRLLPNGSRFSNLQSREVIRAQMLNVVVLGAGHNGLVAAVLLARAAQGRPSSRKKLGGAAARSGRSRGRRTSRRRRARTCSASCRRSSSRSSASTCPSMRRDPHYFLPTTDGRYLLFGSDRRGDERAVRAASSPRRDCDAHTCAASRDRAAPRRRRADVARRAALDRRDARSGTCARRCARRSSISVASRSRTTSRASTSRATCFAAMYAVTDGFSGLTDVEHAGHGDELPRPQHVPPPGIGRHVHDRERRHGHRHRAHRRRRARGGASSRRRTPSTHVKVGRRPRARRRFCRRHRSSSATSSSSTRTLRDARPVSAATDCRPSTTSGSTTTRERHDDEGEPRAARPAEVHVPSERVRQAASARRFTSCPDEREVTRVLARWLRGRASAASSASFRRSSGTSTRRVDQTLRDERRPPQLRALRAMGAVRALGRRRGRPKRRRYVKHLLSICDRFAPGTSDLVVDTFSLTPPKIEEHFGITRGHIHHVDNGSGFADRLPYATPIAGLYSCSAGTHPAGSVIGARRPQRGDACPE